jgi:hypothetical protein
MQKQQSALCSSQLVRNWPKLQAAVRLHFSSSHNSSPRDNSSFTLLSKAQTMAETQGAASSIVSIVGLGLTLATTLQTYVEFQRYPEDRLRDISCDVSSTAAILRQLQDIIDADKNIRSFPPSLKVLKDEGRDEIEIRAVQCEKIFKTIIALMTKAGGASRWKGKVKTASIDTRTLKLTGLIRVLKWTWLESRIKRSQEQLGFLKMNLLLILQVATLARHQVG